MRMIPVETARWRLATLWFSTCAVIMLFLIAQSFGGAFEGDEQRLWGWALPNFLPTIALMLSVFAADALVPSAGSTYVRSNFSNLALWLSAFYLGVLLLAILAPPLASYFRDPPQTIDRMVFLENANLFLGPVQGLVVAALGVLFFLKDKPQQGPSSAAPSLSEPALPPPDGTAGPGRVI
jgi:hypothetical protein